MHASEHFGIVRSAADDWFDAIVDADTQLCVDPFLVFQEKAGAWETAHEELIGHFEKCFLLIASAGGNPAALPYRKAVSLLKFREPKELCLGYTSRGTAGAGGGDGMARQIAAGIVEAIKRGLKDIRHFEELGILNERIGPDLISDITCNILKPRLIRYTQDVAIRHRFPVRQHDVHPLSFDPVNDRWVGGEAYLPTNPATGGPLILVPQRFLRDLPTLHDKAWLRDSYAALRDDFNYMLMSHISKEKIVEVARRRAEVVRAWTIKSEGLPSEPYNFDDDPKGVYAWDTPTSTFAKNHPVAFAAPTTEAEFFVVIETVIQQFKLFIEEQGGWELLWNEDGKEKQERAIQRVFFGIGRSYCRANNVVLDGEVNLGRGPVDFKFSNGYSRRAHLEVKKLSHDQFWHGIDHQLPSYMTSDECHDGWLLAVQLHSDPQDVVRAGELPARVARASKKHGRNFRHALIDGREKVSASKIRATD